MKSQQEFNNETEYRAYLRLYYAGLAMQGLCSEAIKDQTQTTQGNARKTAGNAVVFADELLKILIPETK